MKNVKTLQVILGAFFISFSGVWVKIVHVTPTVSAFYRVFFGFLFLLIASLFNNEIRRLTSLEISLIILCGLLFAIDLFCWHRSITLIGPGLATILGNFQVFILTLVGYFFFKEAISRRFILAIPLATMGLFLIVGADWSNLGQGYKIGIYLGLATALFYSGFILSLRRLSSSSSLSFFYLLMLTSLATAFFLGLEILVTDGSFTIPDGQSWFGLIVLSLFSQTIGWVLITNALPKIKASLTGLILLLQPTLSFFWDVLFFNRLTTFCNWLGVIIVLSAMYLGMSSGKKKS